MTVETPTDIREREARIMTYRQETNTRLRKLLASSISLQEIARLLNADEFLVYQDKGKGKAPVVTFDAAGFIDREVKQELPLQLPTEFIRITHTVLPPDEGELIQTGTGKGKEKREIIPRSRYVAEVLTELNQPYSIVEGTNAPNMVRAESYRVFLVPGLEKLVLVNDEEGNATFVIHRVDNPQTQWQEYAHMTKDELRAQGEERVTVMIYAGSPEEWKMRLTSNLMRTPVRLGAQGEDLSKEKIDYEKAPEGWKTVGAMAAEFEVNSDTIKKIISEHISLHPEWKQTYRDIAGKPSSHYDPELVGYVKANIEARVFAPEGWATSGQLAAEFPVWPKKIRDMADKYRAEHPEWFQTYRDRVYKNQWEHFHPDLVAILRKELEEFSQTAPEGWQKIDVLVAALHVDDDRIREEAEKYRSAHPEWFKKFKPRADTGRHGEHLHPELVKILTDKFAHTVEYPPVGWVTNGALARMLQIAKPTTKRTADKFRAQNPHWFKPYRNKTGDVSEHYHPDLVKEVEREIKERGANPPEGWKTIHGLTTELKAQSDTIKRVVDRFRVSNPEWFGEYLDGIKRKREHLHPDLIEKIKAELQDAE